MHIVARAKRRLRILDGYLIAAEIGAEFSSMELSNPYAISPAFGSVTKTLFYGWTTFTGEDGGVVPGAASKGRIAAIPVVISRPARDFGAEVA